MKTETKIQLVEDWRTEAGVGATDTLTFDHLDAMWNFAERNQNVYSGIREYCHDFDDSYLARITKRAKMRALLEVRIAPVKHTGKLPGAGDTTDVAVPQYIGTGNRRDGSQMVPIMDEEGEVTDEGATLMIAQALQQMEGHRNRYHLFMPPTTLKKLDAYMTNLRLEVGKRAVQAKAA